MMRVYLRGYFYENLGDDLFIHILAQRYPEINFCLITNSEYAQAYSFERNIDVIKMGKLNRAIEKVKITFLKTKDIYENVEKRCDISIVIGGSMFQELPGDKNTLERLKSFPGRYSDTYILGVNFGPFYTQNYLNYVFDYLKKMKDICFRDMYSYTIFRKLNNVRWASDIVFNIENIIPKARIKNEKKVCDISVMNFNNKNNLKMYAEEYMVFLVKIIRKYCLLGYEIHLLSFCKMEGDETAIFEVFKRCDGNLRKCIKEIKYNGHNWEEIVKDISKAECVIATRFHSMILGLAYQIPTLPIIYSKKCSNVLKDLGFDNEGITLEYLQDVEIDNLKFIKLKNCDAVKKDAEKQFETLDKLFGRKRNVK